MPDLVNVTIDDTPVAVPAGTLVVDAAKAAGIEIPVFCSHPKLDPLGACRMCLVEFPGPRGSRLDTACTVRVSEGMVVKTNTPQVKAVREANLGFILINHPLDCPICDKGGECPLQDQTVEYGPGASKFIEPKRRKQKHYPISDLIMLDQERCILCWRCIRYLEEWEDKPQIGLFERGGETMIDTFPGQPVDAKTSGSIIDICPVGALTNRVSRFRYRPWELKKTPSVCNHCAVGCNLRLDERAHALRRIVARENMAVNDEWICDKGRFVHQFVDQPERLATPMVRHAERGALREATWDEALARIVERLGAITDASGPNAVGGVASARISNEAAYLFQKFFRALVGTNNVDYPRWLGCAGASHRAFGHHRHRQERPDRARRHRSERGRAGARPAHQARRPPWGQGQAADHPSAAHRAGEVSRRVSAGAAGQRSRAVERAGECAASWQISKSANQQIAGRKSQSSLSCRPASRNHATRNTPPSSSCCPPPNRRSSSTARTRPRASAAGRWWRR